MQPYPKKPQKDRVFALSATRKRQVARLLQTHSTFTKSVVVSIGVSKLGANGP